VNSPQGRGQPVEQVIPVDRFDGPDCVELASASGVLDLAHRAVDLAAELAFGALIDEAASLVRNLADRIGVGLGVSASGLYGPRQYNKLPQFPQHRVSSFG
jgi:hypothetical protein